MIKINFGLVKFDLYLLEYFYLFSFLLIDYGNILG